MAHGAPDNYQVQQKAITYRLDDMAELAARIGSPDIFHRLGDVVFIDSFENGLGAWTKDTIEGLATIKLTSVEYKTGGFACKLIHPGDDEHYCGIYRGMSFHLGGKIGFEYSLSGWGDKKEVGIKLRVYDGSDVVCGIINYSETNKNLSYIDWEGNPQVFASGINLVLDYPLWTTWKLIIDMVKEEYCKLIVGQTTYSLKDISLYKVESGLPPQILAEIWTRSEGANSSTLIVDDCILTQNEP